MEEKIQAVYHLKISRAIIRFIHKNTSRVSQTMVLSKEDINTLTGIAEHLMSDSFSEQRVNLLSLRIADNVSRELMLFSMYEELGTQGISMMREILNIGQYES